jgi:hypothetical protein
LGTGLRKRVVEVEVGVDVEVEVEMDVTRTKCGHREGYFAATSVKTSWDAAD